MDAPGLADAGTLVTDAGTAAELPPLGIPGDDGGLLDGPVITALDSAAPGEGDAGGGDVVGPELGVPCGGAAWCNGATPICCMGTTDAGGPVFQCITPADSCVSGYSVECDSENACAGTGQGCCHYSHSTKCVAIDPQTQACPGGGVVRVCDPRAADPCGAGLSCKVVTTGWASPYYACQQ
jgi:hypothetical protein